MIRKSIGRVGSECVTWKYARPKMQRAKIAARMHYVNLYAVTVQRHSPTMIAATILRSIETVCAASGSLNVSLIFVAV